MIITPMNAGLISNQDIGTSGYQDLLFNVSMLNLSNTGTTWASTSAGNWLGKGSSAYSMAGSARLRSQYVASDAHFVLGFDETQGDNLQTVIDAGVYIYPVTSDVYSVRNGTFTNLGTASIGDWIAIHRNIATGVFTIQKSPDGTTWTDMGTISGFTSTNLLYPQLNIYTSAYVCYQPQAINL